MGKRLVMSKLHDRKTVVLITHMTQADELSDTKNKDLYRPRLCHCPECGKTFKSFGDLIEHQDAMQCGIFPL